MNRETDLHRTHEHRRFRRDFLHPRPGGDLLPREAHLCRRRRGGLQLIQHSRGLYNYERSDRDRQMGFYRLGQLCRWLQDICFVSRNYGCRCDCKGRNRNIWLANHPYRD